MTRTSVRIAALVAALALVVSACGGSSSDDSSADGTSAQGNASDSGGDSGSSGTAGVEFGDDFDGSVQACGEIAGAFAALALGPSAALLGSTDNLGDLRKQLSGETFTVPTELEGPFRTLDEAYAEIEQALDGVNLADAFNDPSVAARVEEATAAYDTDEVRAALDDVSTFLEENCSSFGPGDLGY